MSSTIIKLRRNATTSLEEIEKELRKASSDTGIKAKRSKMEIRRFKP